MYWMEERLRNVLFLYFFPIFSETYFFYYFPYFPLNEGASQKHIFFIFFPIFPLCSKMEEHLRNRYAFHTNFSHFLIIYTPHASTIHEHTHSPITYAKVVKIYSDLFTIDKAFHWNDEQLILARPRNFVEYRLAFTGYCMPFSPGLLARKMYLFTSCETRELYLAAWIMYVFTPDPNDGFGINHLLAFKCGGRSSSSHTLAAK